MQRRQFLTLGTALAGVAFANLGNGAETLEKIPPSKLPFKRVSVKGDESKAVFFFDFSCQFSANYHIPMLNWERTLPKGSGVPQVSVEYVPLINLYDVRRKNDMAVGAAGYYAGVAMSRDRAQLKNFLEGVYDSRLRDGYSLSSRELWAAACKKAQFDLQTFLTTAAKTPKPMLGAAARRLSQYQITTTPSVGVAGQFVLTPDEVNGDPEMFFNVLSGLASNYLLS